MFGPGSRNGLVAKTIVKRIEVTKVGRKSIVASATNGRQLRWKSTVKAVDDEEEMVKIPKDVPHHKLEQVLGDNYAAVQARRSLIMDQVASVGTPEQASAMKKIPAAPGDFDIPGFYDEVHGSSCENVIGYVPMPVGVIGPLVVNNQEYYVPMATTEGALLASTNRGARAIREGGGATVRVHANGMTRSPVVSLKNVSEASAFKAWVEDPQRLEVFKAKFSETTRFGKLDSVKATMAGRYVYMRFRAETGDAMGMNMVGKGVNRIMEHILQTFPGVRMVSLSSNMCTDKKPSAINWTQGRGKSVVAEVTLSKEIVKNVLKTTIPDLCQLNIAKNLVGSALAGSIGGFNAHASNLVTAFFLASGQDPAQNVESSNCMILMEPINSGESIHISATMPSVEVGTVGGGTSLTTQKAVLEMLGCQGSNRETPGANAEKLASLVCATVLAGEISLNAALASNHLISAHMDLNRKAPSGSETSGTAAYNPVSTGKKTERGKVQPGLKKQRTSHDHDLMKTKTGRRFGHSEDK